MVGKRKRKKRIYASSISGALLGITISEKRVKRLGERSFTGLEARGVPERLRVRTTPVGKNLKAMLGFGLKTVRRRIRKKKQPTSFSDLFLGNQDEV